MDYKGRLKSKTNETEKVRAKIKEYLKVMGL